MGSIKSTPVMEPTTGPPPPHFDRATIEPRRRQVRRATVVGGLAILMWSTLAVLTTTTGSVPPFLLMALTFAIGSAAAISGTLIRRRTLRIFLVCPGRAWLIGIGGLFGYHFFYFLALRSAPAAEANLINYLWPLLIVVLASALPGERLRWWHLAGALAGLAGTVLLITGGRLMWPATLAPGYAAALACALIWAVYSVLSRRLAEISTDMIGAFCGATAILAGFGHLAFEHTVWPRGLEWSAVIVMGLGPVGLAFLAWDVGMKHGDIRALAAAAYLTPLLSTALLIAFDRATASGVLAAATLLITGGAVLASKELWSAGRPRPTSR